MSKQTGLLGSASKRTPTGGALSPKDAQAMDSVISQLSKPGPGVKSVTSGPVPTPTTGNAAPKTSVAPQKPQFSLVLNKENAPVADVKNVEQFKNDLSKIPSWVRHRLQEEIRKRKELEAGWEANIRKLETYLEEVETWKKASVETFEQWRDKQHSSIIEMQQGTSLQLHGLQEKMNQKEEEIRKLTSTIADKDKELKNREAQLVQLSQELEKYKTGGAKIGVTRTDSGTPEKSALVPSSSGTGSGSFLGLASSISIILPQKVVVEGAVPFQKRFVDWMDASARADVLLDLLVMKGDTSLVQAMCDVIRNKPVEDEVIRCIVQIFEGRGEILRLVETFISKEVDKTQNQSSATLFRSNSTASKMLTEYTKLVGNSYLTEVVKPLLADLFKTNEALEVDPNKATANVDTKANMKKLADLSQKFIDTIVSSSDKCPQEFRYICSLLINSVGRKFPDDTLLGVKNFIFLRFLCPSILAPPKMLSLGEPKEETRRTLLLISKVLQNVVNGIEFKEPYMLSLNSFLTQNSEKIKTFMTKLGDVSPLVETAKKDLSKGHQAALRESVKGVIFLMNEVREPLLEALKSYEGHILTQNMKFLTMERAISVCGDIGIPKKKKITFAKSDAKTEEFVSLFVEEENLPLALIDIATTEKDSLKIYSSIITLFNSTAHQQKLTHVLIQATKRDMEKRLMDFPSCDCATNKLFVCLSQVISGGFLRGIYVPLYEELEEMLEELNKPATLVLLSQKFIAAILKGMALIPTPLWQICNFIFENMENKKLAVDSIVKFLFRSYFCPALESPENYGVMEDAPKKKLKKGLSMIAESISNVSATEEVAKASQEIKRQYEIIAQNVDSWLKEPSQGNDLVILNSDWSQIEESMKLLHQLIFDKSSVLATKLSQVGTTKKISFKLGDLLGVLVTNKAEFTKSNYF